MANLFIYHFVMVSSDCIVEIDGAVLISTTVCKTLMCINAILKQKKKK